MTEAERAEVAAEAEGWIQEYEDAWESVDMDRVMALNVRTPDFAWSGRRGIITRGHDVFEANTRAVSSAIESVDMTHTDRQITVLSRDAVVILDVGMVTGTGSDGTTSEEPYTYMYVLVRQDGELKLLLGHGG
jgi:ketosteroid isomerase-like protein